jgi:hypothetical protein
MTTHALHLRLVALAAALAAAAFAPACAAASYGWPVQPFDREHPVRGNFGDPRTIFRAPPTTAGALTGSGDFTFHRGVDISAPDGTRVFPVAAGTVVRVTDQMVAVASAGGTTFEYWHVAASVAVGAAVSARSSVLGRILPGAGHVHLTELRSGRPVNPLALGHLTPYSDHTRPRVGAIGFRSAETGPELLANYVQGRVILVAEASDLPSMRVPGRWRDMPVTPAVVSWHLATWNGRTVVHERVAVDFRSSIPEPRSLWTVYARGSFQNMAVFGDHYSWLQPGSYLFKLTTAPFDTRRLADGVYDLVVTAADMRGNRGSASRRFLVHNRD